MENSLSVEEIEKLREKWIKAYEKYLEAWDKYLEAKEKNDILPHPKE